MAQTLDRKFAALLNFTGNSYHWGCYGTSLEIYQTLIERGYYVETMDVNDTHSMTPTPELTDHFVQKEFFLNFAARNPRIVRLLKQADLIVVNGEGTLHRDRPGPMNLLYLMLSAKLFLNKKVHLINHSLYPSGSEQAHEMLDLLYGSVGQAVDKVVPRERRSASVCQRLGVKHQQGFDCLARFINRHKLIGSATRENGILLAGGIAMTPEWLETFAKTLGRFAGDSIPIRFLTGAKNDPAREDMLQFDIIKKAIQNIELIEADSMEAWLGWISRSSCLISGRYHHSLAAAALGTPFLVFPSNTPKIEATMEMLDYPAVVSALDESSKARIGDFIDDSIKGRSKAVRADKVEEILELSGNNFADL